MEALHLRAQSLCCVAQRLVDCSLKVHKSAFNLLSVSSKPRPNGISRNMSFKSRSKEKAGPESHVRRRHPVQHRATGSPGGAPSRRIGRLKGSTGQSVLRVLRFHLGGQGRVSRVLRTAAYLQTPRAIIFYRIFQGSRKPMSTATPPCCI